MRTRLTVATVSLLTLAACGFPKTGVVLPPVEGPAAEAAATKWKGTTPEKLAEGRKLFSEKCNGCHNHPDVDAIPEAKWPGIVAEMREKAKLDEKQGESVLAFVLASRKQP